MKKSLLRTWIENNSGNYSEFGRSIGVSPQTVYYWFKVGHIPKKKKIIQTVSKVTGIAEAELIKEWKRGR